MNESGEYAVKTSFPYPGNYTLFGERIIYITCSTALFDMHHKTVPLSANDASAGVVPVPTTVIAGSIEIDESNVDLFLQNPTPVKGVEGVEIYFYFGNHLSFFMASSLCHSLVLYIFMHLCLLC
ncbi:MAG: periplasmic binding protein/LacI transcriptional regulator [Segetibacter sp.]|nr:periplasmic binding protein/LacI transcriptional regulator [Segetibacter sp.]